jgi:hypothetical protein
MEFGLPLSKAPKSISGSLPGGATSLAHFNPQHSQVLHLDFRMAWRHTPPKAKKAPDRVSQKALSKVLYQGSLIFLYYLLIIIKCNRPLEGLGEGVA